jgi:Transglycosylase-like domain
MQRISAHLPSAIKHNLHWAFFALITIVAGLISISPSRAATATSPTVPDLHTSRDGVFQHAVTTMRVAIRQAVSAALPMHRVRAGESMSEVALRSCDGHARDWTGIYAASRHLHLTAYNANMLAIGQELAVDCAYEPAELRYAIDPPHPAYHLVADVQRNSGGKIWGYSYGYPYYCSSAYGKGYNIPCSSTRHAHPVYRSVPVSGSYHGSGGMQECIISRESGGNSQVMNSTGHYGLYQFSEQTWVAHGGSPGSFGHASVAEQNQVYYSTVAQDGYSDWAPYDGC